MNGLLWKYDGEKGQENFLTIALSICVVLG